MFFCSRILSWPSEIMQKNFFPGACQSILNDKSQDMPSSKQSGCRLNLNGLDHHNIRIRDR